MRYPAAIFLLAVLFSFCAPFLASGCGSAGGGVGFDIDGRPLGQHAPSPFAGRWSGAWAEMDSDWRGTITMTIDARGSLTLVLIDAAGQTTAAGSGSVTRTGVLKAVYRRTDGPRLTARGAVAVEADGRLRGRLETFDGDRRLGWATLELVRQQ